MNGKSQWESVYSTKNYTEVSWFQQSPKSSLELIKLIGVSKSAQIIDIGGGASTLVDNLLDQGYSHLSVLDISDSALRVAQERLGSRSTLVNWDQADITEVQLPQNLYELWHDRAVFHFLITEGDRQKYKQNLLKSLKSGGFFIVSTFGLEAPPRCSGLDVVRYSFESLCSEFEEHFDLIHTINESHLTPMTTTQNFIYCCFRKK
jgi:trans-aconitate methyltransferase